MALRTKQQDGVLGEKPAALINLPRLAVESLAEAELFADERGRGHAMLANAAATLMLAEHAGEIVKELRQLRGILTKRAES